MDEKLHGQAGELEDVFEAGIDCSSKTMYPGTGFPLQEKVILPACIKNSERSFTNGLPVRSCLHGMKEGACIRLMKKIPGKIGILTGKAFGDSVYDMQMSEYKEEYRVV